MPFSKEQNRRIYITALVISFLLIVGSIYLHLKQKTHLGRMSFNLDRERVKPTGGVEATTWLNDYESATSNQTNENSNSEDNIEEENGSLEAAASTTVVDDVSIRFDTSKQTESEDHMNRKSTELSAEEANDKQVNIMDNNDEIIDAFAEDIDLNNDYELGSVEQDWNACLRCLCMTVNKCHPTFCGSGNPCGLYRISKMYWIDAGKPTIAGGTTDNEDQDYLTCVNEDTCATTAIRQYYDRYKKVCNKYGAFDCRDQIALHLLGPSGCLKNNLSYIHTNRMKSCLIESNLYYFSYSESDEY